MYQLFSWKFYLIFCLLAFFKTASAVLGYDTFTPAPALHLSLPAQLSPDVSVVIPFWVSEEIYQGFFPKNGEPPRLNIRVHLYDAVNRYQSEKVLDLTQNIAQPIPAVSFSTTRGLKQISYALAPKNNFAQFEPIVPNDLESAHLIGVAIHTPELFQTHGRKSVLNMAARLYAPDETLAKIYFPIELSWENQNSLVLNQAITEYIQAGGLTCEFASAKNALDMLGISVNERRDLIPRFPQAPVQDSTKSPLDYFLGDYALDKKVPQTVETSASPLGGYGLHLGQPYLEKVIRPYAPLSELQRFSLATLDQAVSQNIPVIVQGLQISYDNHIQGGQIIQAGTEDTRGLVNGEHTYVIYGKSTGGQYWMKDPLKRSFQLVPGSVIEQSVRAFERYGAVGNMILVQKEPLQVRNHAEVYWQDVQQNRIIVVENR